MDLDLFFCALQAGRSGAEYRLIMAAYDTASLIHNGQVRDSGEQFINHPRRVGELLLVHGCGSTEEIILGFLHDVEEKSDISGQGIVHNFGAAMWEWIVILSNEITVRNPITGRVLERTRKTPENYFGPISLSCPKVVCAKLADRLDNTLTMFPWTRQKKLEYIRETREYLLKPFARKASESLFIDIQEQCDQVEALLRETVRSF
jgi:GTP pyrophosphokinase